MGEIESTGRSLSAVKLSLAARQLREREAELGLVHSEPLAIVALSCCFPGADDSEQFWQRLESGRVIVGPLPAKRRPADASGQALPWGGWFDDLDRFEVTRFGIPAHEAAAMDPQHQLWLQVALKACGQLDEGPSSLGGSRTGVFLGIYQDDHGWLQAREPRRIDAYSLIGASHSLAPGRLSHLLDLRGPSMAIDTACSSSLVAVHLAAQSLRLGECDAAIVGGVNLVLSPLSTLKQERWGKLSPSGSCRPFDADADGFVRGEGCGVVILKRLGDALRAGEAVHAVIRGTAVGQDGRGSELTAPRGPTQQEVLRRSLENGRVAGQDVSYVEAHGTGTVLGDALEIEALSEVYGAERPAGRPCAVGSLKSSFGHLEAAAGVAGLIKAVLCLQHGRLPPQANLRRLNPHLELRGGALVVPTEGGKWFAGDGTAFAGVSAFGFGGTNAHVVLESAPKGAVRPKVRARGVGGFYDRLSHIWDPAHREEYYITFGPFDRVIAGFSWLKTFCDPGRDAASTAQLLECQRALRELTYAGLDFGDVHRVLDFGCGYGTDLLMLARRHPHLALDGYTLSAEQAAIATRKARASGVAERVRFFQRDSVREPFPERYELAIGFEVAGHIQDKAGLFRNLAEHLAPGGRVVLADFASQLGSSVEHPEVQAFTPNNEEWSQALARGGLRLEAVTDISTGVANFLEEPDFETHLEEVCAAHDVDASTRAYFRAFANIGQALRRGLIRYVLLRARREPALSEDALARVNLAALGGGGAASGQAPAVEEPWGQGAVGESSSRERAERLTLQVREALGRIVGIDPAQVDPDAPVGALGLNSLKSLELRRTLEVSLGLALPATLAWNHPSVATLVAYLQQRIEQQAPHPAAQALPVPARRASSTDEPIAIVSLACRLPGGAQGPAAFWRLLCEGRDAAIEVPPDRWDLERYFDPDPAAPGKTNSRRGGFLVERVDLFDPYFFGISPREAARLDPQQRLLLEVAWEALESGGLATARLAGSRTGVFVGISTNDYAGLQDARARDIDAYSLTGTAYSVASGRLSYLLDLRGPSLSIDTACSSSLVAVHLACESLRRDECEMALAGGVNLMLAPELTVARTKLGVLSSHGHCKTFDARADGFVRGEGCGVVVLKRLSEARAAGDRILAVVRGSAVNQDGRTSVLTAPSGLAQQAVYRQALARAGVEPGQVDLVEAHGTATALGDLIELEGLAAVYGQPRPEGRRCAVGSVKTNLGHLEAAAGITGLIKAVLCLGHGRVVPHLHCELPNPGIDLGRTSLYVPGEGAALAPVPEERFAAVSSFGMSGTNAHVILQGAPAGVVAPGETGTSPWLVPISARSAEALRSLATRYHSWLETGGGSGASLAEIAYNAALRRSHHRHRAALVARDPAGLAESLQELLRQDGGAAFRPAGEAPRVVFICCGQGSLYEGAARGLLREPAFRAAFDACDAALRFHLRRSLREDLFAPIGAWQGGQQPLLFALQVSLAALWREWGIVPAALVGHSMGEVAAAHLAGALSLEDACRVICARASLMARKSGQGTMLLVEVSEQVAAGALSGLEQHVSIAALNAPGVVVLSGRKEALEELRARFEGEGRFCRWIAVDVPGHSPMMDDLRPLLEESLGGLEPREEQTPLYSTVTGRRCRGKELQPGYWGSNLREPVRFAEAIGALANDGGEVFVELSPHPVLSHSVEQVLRALGRPHLTLPSLKRGQDDAGVLLASLSSLYSAGAPVRFESLYRQRQRSIELPGHPWQRESFWCSSEDGRAEAAARGGSVHPLLGRCVSVAEPGTRVWEKAHSVRDGRAPWSLGTLVAMAQAAAVDVRGPGSYELLQMELLDGSRLAGSADGGTQLSLEPERGGILSFRVHGRERPDCVWQLLARGRIRGTV